MEGNLITRDTVVSEWMDLRPTFLSQDIIRSSWKTTGLFPLNPGVFRAEDFAPSHTYSIKGHLPAGYPSVQLTDSDTYDSEEEPEETDQIALEESQPTIESVHEQQPVNLPSDHEHIKTEQHLITLQDVLPPPGTRLDTKAQMTNEIARLRDRLAKSVSQGEAAAAHAQLMAQQNQDLQKTMNAKPRKRNGKKKLTTDARLVTSEEFVMLRRKEMEEEENEAKRVAEKTQVREMEQEQRRQDRIKMAHTVAWSVGWRNRKKEDLKDLCYALGVSTDGTRGKMIERVETHLAAHPSLAHDDRYRALFLSRVTDELLTSHSHVTSR
ncbi:hypothetical protein BDV93DRAFT_541526 [Ceratobasidium sp. AG-I]|nr:hypothetical protein BDV93DRAFT_541526 [Ceratobasidium sp. AG-I]